MSSVSPFKYSKNIMWIKVIIEKVQTLNVKLIKKEMISIQNKNNLNVCYAFIMLNNIM